MRHGPRRNHPADVPAATFAGRVDSFAAYLVELRQARRMTRGDVARLIDADQTVVRRWELGETLPSLWMFAKLILALKLTPEEYHSLISLLFTERRGFAA